MSRPAILWFRGELRLADNPALMTAAASGGPVLPLYILGTGGRPLGGAARWWLHGSLAALARALAAMGATLVLRRGSAAAILPELVRATGAASVHWNAPAEPPTDDPLILRLREAGASITVGAADLLAEPATRLTRDGRPLRLFAPFWRALQRQAEPPAPLAAPTRLRSYAAPVAGDALADWRLRPSRPDWASGIAATWTPGEPAAEVRLAQFLAGSLRRYAAERDRLDRPGTSLLSPHLRWGEIGPRQIWHRVKAASHGRTAAADAFLRELAWRDFSYHLLQQKPSLAREPLQPGFAQFPWRNEAAALAAWQQGRTGYPLVDAAMRQLWHTGWMPNRARMVVASFLVKHLLLPWQQGEAWFWDTLVDADPANNGANWQWVAGSGSDAAPFFRIFNPTAQARKFDPEGAYARRWLGDEVLPPIIEHAAARERALAAFRQWRQR